MVTSGLLIVLPADWALCYIQSPGLLLKLLFSGCFIYLHSLRAAKVLLYDSTPSQRHTICSPVMHSEGRLFDDNPNKLLKRTLLITALVQRQTSSPTRSCCHEIRSPQKHRYIKRHNIYGQQIVEVNTDESLLALLAFNQTRGRTTQILVQRAWKWAEFNQKSNVCF